MASSNPAVRGPRRSAAQRSAFVIARDCLALLDDFHCVEVARVLLAHEEHAAEGAGRERLDDVEILRIAAPASNQIIPSPAHRTGRAESVELASIMPALLETTTWTSSRPVKLPIGWFRAWALRCGCFAPGRLGCENQSTPDTVASTPPPARSGSEAEAHWVP
jgi:hypothetical protein